MYIQGLWKRIEVVVVNIYLIVVFLLILFKMRVYCIGDNNRLYVIKKNINMQMFIVYLSSLSEVK